jgi:hypothetical protein
MRESAVYGVAMFPLDGGGEAEMGVVDEMVLERAKKRRKVLEAEEREEFGDIAEGGQGRKPGKNGKRANERQPEERE